LKRAAELHSAEGVKETGSVKSSCRSTSHNFCRVQLGSTFLAGILKYVNLLNGARVNLSFSAEKFPAGNYFFFFLAFFSPGSPS
jgi:hypothetical protein